MTTSAQQALRLIISDYSNTTRFALACNDSSKVIEPIQSRCAILRFSKLKDEEIKERLLKVCEKENINFDSDGIKALINTSEGDMRYALNNLQSTFVGFGILSYENVYKIVDIPRPEIMQNIFNLCKVKNIDQALDNVDKLLEEGYNAYDIINVISRIIQDENEIQDDLRFELLKLCSLVKIKVLDGIDSVAQIYGFIAEIVETIIKTNK